MATEPDAGPRVLLLHGQPGSGASWSHVTRILEPEFRVLAPDRPGYGATWKDAQGIVGNVQTMAEYLQANTSGPVVVVGHSWAGGVAVLLAHRYPALVSGLVLVGSVGTPESINGLDHLLTLPRVGDAVAAIGLLGMAKVLPRIRTVVGRPSGNRGAWLASALPDATMAPGDDVGWGRTLRAFMAEQRALVAELPLITAVLPLVAVPTVVIVGSWDVVVPVHASRALATAIPQAELVVVPQVGHFVPRDAPHAVARAVRDVVRRAPDQ